MDDLTPQAQSAREQKSSPAFWILSGTILAVLIGYFAWDHWPEAAKEADPIADAAQHSTTVVEIRGALNNIPRAPGVELMYHQAVGNGGNDNDVSFSVQPFLNVDANKITADMLATPLPQVLAIAKVSDWEYKNVHFDADFYRNGKLLAMHAVYSRSTVKKMNLTKIGGARALFEAADSHSLDPGLQWSSH